MNIMKTNMLLLNNKFMKEDADTTTVQAPVPSTTEPQKGMKALSFLGMQNLMANPKLAQGVGVMNEKTAEKSSADSYVAPYSSNIAFKGNLKNVTKAMALAITASAALASFTSCKENVDVRQTQIVNLDAFILELRAQMEALRADMNAQNQVYINALQSILDAINKQTMSIEEFKAMVYSQNSAILDAIALFQNVTKEEAKAMVDRIMERYGDDVKGALAEIKTLLQTNNDLLGEILATLKDLKASADKAEAQRDSLIKLNNQIVKNGKVSVELQKKMLADLCALIQQNNAIIYNEQQTINTIRQTGSDLQATIYEVANQLGVKVEYLADVISITGKSLEEVMKMSKSEILAVLQQHLNELQLTNGQLVVINDKLSNIDSNVEGNSEVIINAANEINEVLNKISGQIDALSAQFADAVKMFRGKLNQLNAYAAEIVRNGHVTNAMLANLINQMFALRNDVKSIKATAEKIREDLKNGVTIDYNQLEEMFKILNMHQQASKDEIIAKLDEFIDGQTKIENAINNVGGKVDYISSLIGDNSEILAAIKDFANANEENIAAAAEKLAAKLDALIAKADAILKKMDGIANVLYQYGDQILNKLGTNDQILAAIKANGKKIDTTNMTLDQLKAEVEKILPELQKLNGNATTANTYLDIISKRMLELKDQIAELKANNPGITKEELEELWKKHDADAYNNYTKFLNELHADNMDKAEEIIGYLKAGNKTAADIYNLLLDFKNSAGNDAEALKKLLQAVYDYLPELICKCNCQGNCDNNENTHEGIIDIIS